MHLLFFSIICHHNLKKHLMQLHLIKMAKSWCRGRKIWVDSFIVRFIELLLILFGLLRNSTASWQYFFTKVLMFLLKLERIFVFSLYYEKWWTFLMSLNKLFSFAKLLLNGLLFNLCNSLISIPSVFDLNRIFKYWRKVSMC